MSEYDDDDDDRESVSDGAIMFGWCLVAFFCYSCYYCGKLNKRNIVP